jgi:hypothetical protein
MPTTESLCSCTTCFPHVYETAVKQRVLGCSFWMPRSAPSSYALPSHLTQQQIGTGASAFMAIRVLLDHGVPENQIIFVTILVARTGGLAVLERAFPQVKVVAGAVDENVEERWLSSHVDSEDEPLSADASKYWVITPGMGQLGTAYFESCTSSLSLTVFSR